ADGLPTYHLANVVDDRLMKITHVIRGEEWLSSTAHHVLLYQSFGWEAEMPVFAHLPLILKPSGKGKLSKRDGAKFGFPVFPLEWKDPKEDEIYGGFREMGFLPEAVLNFLAFMGWNPGTDEEMFNLSSLCKAFSMSQINKSGARFDFDKATWYNQQYIIQATTEELHALTVSAWPEKATKEYILSVIRMFQPRAERLADLYEKSTYLFSAPATYVDKPLKKKYKVQNYEAFAQIATIVGKSDSSTAVELADLVKGYITTQELGFGAILPVLRIFITGGMEGPDLFDMMHLLGASESERRIRNGLQYAHQLKSGE
ncbi:MAG: glutamate--tRNA ligase family protein, partial [Bacteroidota bacterium]